MTIKIIRIVGYMCTVLLYKTGKTIALFIRDMRYACSVQEECGKPFSSLRPPRPVLRLSSCTLQHYEATDVYAVERCSNLRYAGKHSQLKKK